MTAAIALAKQRQLVPVSHDLLISVRVCAVRDASSAEEQGRVSTPLEKRVFDHHSCPAKLHQQPRSSITPSLQESARDQPRPSHGRSCCTVLESKGPSRSCQGDVPGHTEARCSLTAVYEHSGEARGDCAFWDVPCCGMLWRPLSIG